MKNLNLRKIRSGQMPPLIPKGVKEAEECDSYPAGMPQLSVPMRGVTDEDLWRGIVASTQRIADGLRGNALSISQLDQGLQRTFSALEHRIAISTPTPNNFTAREIHEARQWAESIRGRHAEYARMAGAFRESEALASMQATGAIAPLTAADLSSMAREILERGLTPDDPDAAE